MDSLFSSLLLCFFAVYGVVTMLRRIAANLPESQGRGGSDQSARADRESERLPESPSAKEA